MPSSGEPSGAEAKLLRGARERGVQITLRQLRELRDKHLIGPPLRRSRGRLGTVVTYPSGAVDLIAAWARLPKSSRGSVRAALILYGSGYQVPPDTFRNARLAWKDSLEGQAASGLLATGSAMGAALMPGALGRLMRQNLRRWLVAHPDEVTGEPEPVEAVLDSVARLTVGAIRTAWMGSAPLETEQPVESKPDAARSEPAADSGLEGADLEEWAGAIGLDMLDGALSILERQESGDDVAGYDPTPQAAQHAAEFLKLFNPELLDEAVESVSDDELRAARDDARALFQAISDMAELVSFRISEEGIDPSIRGVASLGLV